MSLERYEQVIGALGLIAFIVADQFFGVVAAVRVAGLLCLACAALWLIRRTVPVGIEGQPPAFFLSRALRLLAGIAMLSVGIALLAFPSAAGCFLGWSQCV